MDFEPGYLERDGLDALRHEEDIVLALGTAYDEDPEEDDNDE